MHWLIRVCLVAVSLLTPGTPQDIDEIRTRIDQYVAALVDCWDIPGATLAVVRDGQVITAKGYGVKRLGQPEAVTERTLFNIASVTKQFVATVVGHVLRKHNYTWDSPVRAVLGEDFYMKDPYRTAKMTVRDLLSHRVGLPGHNIMRLHNFTRPELMRRLRHLDATAAIRQQYKYNNLMYALAAFVAEMLEGRPWEELARELILTPLGMGGTTWVGDRDRWPEYAQGYTYMFGDPHREISLELNEAFYMTSTAPGGISSNAEDMAKWLMVQLNSGYDPDDRPVLEPSIMRDTWAISMPQGGTPLYRRPDDPVTYTAGETYGMGFSRGYYRGYRMLQHGGSMGGFLTLLSLLPDMNMGVFIGSSLQNYLDLFKEQVSMYAFDLLLGKEPWLNATDACPAANRPPRHPGMQHAKDLYGENIKDFSGKYEDLTKRDLPRVIPFEDTSNISANYTNHAYGDITVYLNETDSELYLAYGPVALWKLENVGDDLTFRAVGQGPFWQFVFEYVEFKECDGEFCSSVTVPFEAESPTVFFRDAGPEPPPVPPCPPS